MEAKDQTIERIARAIFAQREEVHQARAELEQLRQEELASYDPEAFEGSAESGPLVPLTGIERAVRERIAELRAERVRELLRERSLTHLYADGCDESFEIAALTGTSPLFVRREAGRIAVMPDITPEEEHQIIDRMADATIARANRDERRFREEE